MRIGRRHALWSIALLALLVRLLHVLSYDPWPFSDMWVFVDMANHRLTFENLFTAQGACRYAPGYALFLKPFLMALPAHRAFAAVRIAQAALGALTCLLIYRLARRLHSRRAGLAAAGLAALFQHYVFYSSVYMSENLFIPLFLSAFLLLLRATERGGARRLYVAGIAAGGAALVRPAAVALAPLALAAALAGGGFMAGSRLRGAARGLAVVLAGWLTLIGPWAVRNWVATGEPVLIAPTAAFNLAIGNNPGATGWYMDVPTPGLEGRERREALLGIAAGFVAGDPWGAFYVAARLKWNAFWAGVPPWPLDGNNPSLYAGGLYFPVLSWRLALFLGLAGLGVLTHSRPRAALLSASCAAAYVAYSLAFFGQPRFRLPLEAIFLAWGGVAAAAAARALRWPASRRESRWSAGAAALCVAVVLQSWAAAAVTRPVDPPVGSLAASGRSRVLPGGGEPFVLFDGEAVPLDRSRGRYLLLTFTAQRRGPPRATPDNGTLTVTFLDGDGQERSWLNTPTYRLTSLPPGRRVPVRIKSHIPPSAAACRVEISPVPDSPDSVTIEDPALHYTKGNDLALEFLFPYLGLDE